MKHGGETVNSVNKVSSIMKKPPMRAFTMGQKTSNEFDSIRNTLFTAEEFSEYSIETSQKRGKSKVKFDESQLESGSKFEVSIQTK